MLVQAALGNPNKPHNIGATERCVLRFNAVKCGHLECLKMFQRQPGDLDDDIVEALEREMCETAAEYNQLECLKYLHENGYEWDYSTPSSAATEGSLECLRYALENGCPWDIYTCIEASSNMTSDCLQYARERGCSWNSLVMRCAASYGSLACIQYAHNNGCPWNKYSCRDAAHAGNLECLKYLAENGSPYDREVSLYAAMGGHEDCVEYALSLFDHDEGFSPGYWANVIALVRESKIGIEPPPGLMEQIRLMLGRNVRDDSVEPES